MEPRMRSVIHAKVRKGVVIISDRQLAHPCWVKASGITEITGWDFRKLEKARRYGQVRFERRADGIWYDRTSIHKEFRIK